MKSASLFGVVGSLLLTTALTPAGAADMSNERAPIRSASRRTDPPSRQLPGSPFLRVAEIRRDREELKPAFTWH
jgi:hypothetical protein